MFRWRTLVFGVVFLASGCSTSVQIIREDSRQTDPQPPTAFETLIGQIEEQFNSPMFAHAHWGALIKSMDTGEIWYERNAERVFMPASNEKIPTGAAALVELGPDFRYTTTLSHTGTIHEGVIDGDLVVWSNGDPTMYTRLMPDPLSVFRAFADSLKAHGINRITGNLIGDDNAFDEDPYGEGWPFNQLDAWYSAEVGALQLNENYIDLTVKAPASADGQVVVTPNIETGYVQLVNQVRVSQQDRNSVSASRKYGSNEMVISGTMGAGSEPVERSPAIFNATGFYVTVLLETLEGTGIRIDGQAMDCDDIPGWDGSAVAQKRLATHYSRPFSEVLPAMLKPSQNMYAETFARTLGWKESGLGSFENGRRVVQRVLQDWGISSESYHYADGSGLSRYNFISPRTLVTIHEAMAKGPYGQLWEDSLPIAGVDGTMSGRMRGTVAERNVKAKTGTIANTRALSGFVTTAAGERLVFSFLVNGHLVSSRDTEDITDPILVMLAGFDRKE